MRRLHDLDAKDREILGLLEADGRRTNSDIARVTGLSAPTVAERIGRMRDVGIIRAFTVDVDGGKVGLPLLAVIHFRPTTVTDDEAVEIARNLGQVRDCYRITGESCLLMIVLLSDNEQLRALLEQLYRCGDTRTAIVLATEWEGRPIFT